MIKTQGIFPVDQIPQNFSENVINLRIGEISSPLPYNVDPTKPAYHVLYKKNEIPPHNANLEDDYKILEQKTKSFKQVESYSKWIQQLRKELYWEVKDIN